jgi:hypothetical protein
MGEIIFRNPNSTQQPAKGVYRWSYSPKGAEEVPFYVGQAGARRGGLVKYPSTLGRGLMELQRASGLSSDNGRSLDADFIVGTAIAYLTVEKECDCFWEHVSDDPHDEKAFCAQPQDRPILQDRNARIHSRLKQRRPLHTWDGKNPERMQEAEKFLYKEFSKVLEQ